MNYLLALLSAALFIAAFPDFNVAWLAPVAAAPLLAACAREPRPRRRLLLGWICGVVYWFGVCYWIEAVLANYAGVSGTVAWALFLLFCFIKALHMAVFALAAGWLTRGWWAAPALAALWVVVEWSHNYLGFAWLPLGNAGIGMGLPLRLAPFTGVYGISFAFLMVSAVLALALLRRPRAHLAWIFLLLPVAVLPRIPDERPGAVSAVLVQPNISETEAWTPAFARRIRLDLLRLSREAAHAAPGAPAVVAWPEAPAPLYYFQDPGFQSQVNGLARELNTWLLLGIVAYTPDAKPLNSAVLVSPQGAAVTRYDKMNLVPFGEYVPWPFGSITQSVSTEAGDFVPGNHLVVSRAGAHRIGTFICYESVFPGFVRRFAAGGAEVLFNLSNDGYFGKSAARHQHLSIVRMRAVENRRWILRATNDGITVAIDAAGRIRAALPPYTQGAARTAFDFESSTTPYTRLGDWFVFACMAAAAAGLAGSWRLSRGV
ncbi:MAG: apolipoprotein N-acyltransferase [Bryobacteraceae bacterium]